MSAAGRLWLSNLLLSAQRDWRECVEVGFGELGEVEGLGCGYVIITLFLNPLLLQILMNGQN